MKYLLLIISSVFFFAVSAQEKNVSNWQQDGPLTPNFNNQTFRGWVDAICVNANNTDEMLIATRTSGIFRTENNGEHWYCVTDNLAEPMIGCRAMISLPSEPNRVIAITGFEKIEGGIIISSDFGKTWKAVEQDLPTFRWIDFHPTNPNILFACSKNEVFFSKNKGESWKSIGSPDDIDYKGNEMFKVFVKDNSVNIISKARWGAEAFLHELPFSFSKKGKFRWDRWTNNLAPEYQITPEDKIFFIDFSNRVDDVHCFQFESKKAKRTYRTTDGGQTYSLLPIQNFPVGHWWKNELIVSPTDTSILYSGRVRLMKKFNINTGKSVFIKYDAENPGHHDDYRSSHVIVKGGKDYIAMGHDGGVGLVTNGNGELPTIHNANGDLSINLLHSFDVHEKSGRIVFAYQDGPMFYRDKDGTFSDQFIWEGSAAMIQKHYPDEIVGENAYVGIKDKDERIHPIVNGTLGRGGCFLGGYFITYHHYPNRFARGLRNGKIAMNRDVNVSEEVTIPNTKSDIGAIAVCARNPKYIYAATTKTDNGVYKLHVSKNDGKSWINLTEPTVEILGVKEDLNRHLHWNYIKSIAVDPDSGDVVFCGIAGTYAPYGRKKDGVFRVIKSFNGGRHFVDYSEGLPAVPVDELITVESDNGLIFCGTVYGIFYRTKSMKRWAPFNNQLPKAEITGLKYDYCNNVLYASTYGRGLWKTKLGFEVTNTFTEVISTNVIWEDNKILCDNIIVKAGVTLTIKADIEIYHGKEISAEKGGKIVFDGGSVREYCEFN